MLIFLAPIRQKYSMFFPTCQVRVVRFLCQLPLVLSSSFSSSPPQLQVSHGSVPRRTSTASSRRQCSPPDSHPQDTTTTHNHSTQPQTQNHKHNYKHPIASTQPQGHIRNTQPQHTTTKTHPQHTTTTHNHKHRNTNTYKAQSQTHSHKDRSTTHNHSTQPQQTTTAHNHSTQPQHTTTNT